MDNLKNLKSFFEKNDDCNLDIPDFGDFSLFNDVEVSPVFVFRDEENTVIDIERTDEAEILKHPHLEVMYSVYLTHDPEHTANQGFGGSLCVGDFPALAVAKAFESFMHALLSSHKAAKELEAA